MEERAEARIEKPSANRLWYVADAFRIGMSEEDLFEHTKIDPWFLAEIADLVASEQALQGKATNDLDAGHWRELKQKGFSDQRLGQLLNATQDEVRAAARVMVLNLCIAVSIPALLNFR